MRSPAPAAANALLMALSNAQQASSKTIPLLMDSPPSPSASGQDATDQYDAASTEQASSASALSPSSKLRPMPQRSPSASNINVPSHRQSFAENLRNGPSSPRHRHPSFTQAAVQDLMNHPPTNKQANPKFAGRDWREITAGELVSDDDVRWIELDSSVEEATIVSPMPLFVIFIE